MREYRARPAVGGTNFIVAQTSPTMPPYPPSLKEGGRGQEYWTTYWTHAADWLGLTDLPAVTRMCEMWDVYAELMAAMHTDGLTITGSASGRNSATRGKQVPHPLFPTLNQVLDKMERMEGTLGFNPVDRSRIRVERGERGSPLDEWQRSRKERTSPTAA